MAATSPIAVKAPRRPFGLNAIIFIQLLLVMLSAALLAVVGFAQWVMYSIAEDLPSLEINLGIVEIVTLILMFFVNLVCAIGLWRRQRWAWFLTMFQLGVFMISDLYSYFTGAAPESYAWSMLLNVMMVFYLNQREVQAIFMHKNRPLAAGSTNLRDRP